jgi:hypothetical protein
LDGVVHLFIFRCWSGSQWAQVAPHTAALEVNTIGSQLFLPYVPPVAKPVPSVQGFVLFWAIYYSFPWFDQISGNSPIPAKTFFPEIMFEWCSWNHFSGARTSHSWEDPGLEKLPAMSEEYTGLAGLPEACGGQQTQG